MIESSAFAQNIAVTNEHSILTNAAQVRALTQAEAAEQLPIRLRGVVIEKNHDGAFTLIDDTAGMYVWDPTNVARAIVRGDLVELEGVTDPGKFAPHVDARNVRKVGSGKVPPPQLADPDDLFNGRLDAQWIEVSGIVRRVEPVWGGLDFEVSVVPGDGRVLVHASGFGSSVAVDSAVRLHAVCYNQFNKARQMLGPYLSIPQGEPISVIKPALTNLDALPLRSVESLMQFSLGQDGAHRVRVRGAVIYSQPGVGLWIRDAGHGLRVICDVKEPLPIGAEIDVFGFLKRGEYGPLLEDAIYRNTGRVLPANPTYLATANDAFDHDADLIQCEAVVQEEWRALDDIRLKLREGATEFQAVLRMKDDKESLLSLTPGTRVRVAGVCSVGFRGEATNPGTLEPQFFQILLRSPSDITVLQHPSWWSAQHVAWVAGGVAIASLAVVAVVVWIGHRRLREQAAEQLKAETEFAAILNERNRMAREIHDTLSQGLSAISMQLEVVKRQLPLDSKVRELLEVARNLARTNMTAARKAIWNVRSQDLETGDLATALGDVLRNLTEGTETKGEVRVTGQMRRLAPLTENNLLRIGQEAITNAAKYAEAKNILVTLDFEERQFRINVKDDGKGFDVQSPPPSEGGFGLKAMRERAVQLHAEFSVTSDPGKGTVVMVVLRISP